MHPFADLDVIRLDPGMMSWWNMIFLDQVQYDSNPDLRSRYIYKLNAHIIFYIGRPFSHQVEF